LLYFTVYSVFKIHYLDIAFMSSIGEIFLLQVSYSKHVAQVIVTDVHDLRIYLLKGCSTGLDNRTYS